MATIQFKRHRRVNNQRIRITVVLAKVELGGLGGGDVGRAKGTLSGRLPRMDPN